MRNSLVIALLRLGDLVQSFPAISDLSRAADGGEVALMVQQDLVPIARMHPGVTQVIPFDGDTLLNATRAKGEWSRQGLTYVSKLYDLVDELNPDLIVNLTHTAFSANLCSIIKAEEVRGRSLAKDGGTQLNGDWTRYFFTLMSSRSSNPVNLVDLFREIAGVNKGPYDKPVIPPDASRFAAQILQPLADKPIIVLGIGSNHPLRSWDSNLWRTTVELLLNNSECSVVIVGGAGDREASNIVSDGWGERCLNICGETDLVQLAAVIDRCDLFIGHDTGPMHIAAMLDKPCLGIYLAMASAWETAPYRNGAVSIEPNVDCHPCSEQGDCTDPICHQAISPFSIADIALNMLNGVVPDQRDDCTMRVSRQKDGGRLRLEGSIKASDQNRLIWFDLIDVVLERNNRFPKPVQCTAIWRHELTQLKSEVLQLVHKMIGGLQIPYNNRSNDFHDPLAVEIPALIARYPGFRLLFDLYRLDTICHETQGIEVRIENIVKAQEKLLRRIANLQKISEQGRVSMLDTSIQTADGFNASKSEIT